jgi:ubiquitin C-terminal hydrolase
VKITTLINKPRILILHINRFRTTQKGVNKILGNYPIRRSIGDYHLVGFIVHKGSSINAGHYLYYARIEETRWALFNDSKVTEFNIGKEE